VNLQVGQLVRLKEELTGLGLHAGDYAVLVEVDWDSRSYPNGIAGTHGRGKFFFPGRPPSKRSSNMGYMLMYDYFEVLDED
jgi:hypothetical protein